MKTREVVISSRVVYHKYAEVHIDIPVDIPLEEVSDWLFENENIFVDSLDQSLHEAKLEYGFGLGGGMDEKDSENETRYDVINENYGGHI
jgi:hypothetical protein